MHPIIILLMFQLSIVKWGHGATRNNSNDVFAASAHADEEQDDDPAA